MENNPTFLKYIHINDNYQLWVKIKVSETELVK